MKPEKDRIFRLMVFSLLAFFTLLLIGAERRREAPKSAQELPGVVAMLGSEIPGGEDRAAWDGAAAERPLWLLRVSTNR